MEISKIVFVFGYLFVSVCLFTTIVFTADKGNSMWLWPQHHFQMGVANKRQVRFTKTINHDIRSPESDKYQKLWLEKFICCEMRGLHVTKGHQLQPQTRQWNWIGSAIASLLLRLAFAQRRNGQMLTCCRLPLCKKTDDQHSVYQNGHQSNCKMICESCERHASNIRFCSVS